MKSSPSRTKVYSCLLPICLVALLPAFTGAAAALSTPDSDSPPPSDTPPAVVDYPPPADAPPSFPPPAGTSCRDILSQSPSTPSGWSFISTPLASNIEVWCDMTTDNAVAYTYYPCTNCLSVNRANATNGCNALGLQMVVPRSQAHWTSMFSFVTDNLTLSPVDFFKVVPGVYKPTEGASPACSTMSSSSCGSILGSWQAIDGGNWWLSDVPLTSGQLDASSYTASCLLGLRGSDEMPLNASSLIYAAGSCSFYSGNSYICSTNDSSDSFAPPKPPQPPSSPLPPPKPSLPSPYPPVSYPPVYSQTSPSPPIYAALKTRRMGL